MRSGIVVIESFEKWYANQVKYKKVGGPPPGDELRRNTYSVQELAELLDVDTTTVYFLIQRDRIPTYLTEEKPLRQHTVFSEY